MGCIVARCGEAKNVERLERLGFSFSNVQDTQQHTALSGQETSKQEHKVSQLECSSEQNLLDLMTGPSHITLAGCL